MKELKIILVDDNKQFRDGLRFYLEKILNHSVIEEAQDGKAFLQLKNIKKADLILMDISMPNINGIEAARIILNESKHKIIAITSYEDKTYLNELIESGIKGCVFKKDIHDNLNHAIEKVLNNDLYFPDNITLKRN